MSEQTTPAVEEQAAPAAQLQISDILASAQVIQLASTRGAFRADELSQVGGVYDRLVAFLQASGALTPAPAPAETSEKTAEESPAA
ncbi:hypothetical protein UFOVP112_79 [uncultured Caudovirales phage]|uniref:Uncharacterized protein n=1 Tax=uncultured Caudovirales phage TaxID=2100421 RepID=A0A6J5L384_9CAUD|nr:hypothetical protein UFOVP112_79 [uncultured Caudovirales phage]